MRVSINLPMLVVFGISCFCFGWFLSKKNLVTQKLTREIYSYNKEIKNKNVVEALSDYHLCRELGGLRKSCSNLQK